MRNSSVVLGRLPLHAFAEIDPETLSPSTPRGFSFKYIDISAVSEGKLTIPRTSTAFSEAPSRARRVLRAGDVIMSTVRPNLKAFAYCDLDEERYVASTGFAVLRAKESADPYFLLCAVLSNDVTKQIDSFAVGSNYPAINSSDVRRLLIPAHTLPEQKRIAEILSCIDTAIERTEALIAKHQQIKAGLMHDLFTRGVLPNGQLRPPRSEAPGLYRETALGWIPVKWEISGLQAKGRPGSSWIRTGPFGSALKGEHWRTHGHPVITIGALGEGEFLNEELLFVNAKDAARLRDFQLSAGDVVFSRVADVGRSVVIREEQAGWIMSSNLMRIALDANLVRPDYLQMQLAGDWRVKAQIRVQVNSGGRDVANSAVLSRLRFAWPDPDEQDRIINRALLEERSLQAERRKTEKLQKQKLGLMQDLLTGRAPVPAAPEPAEAAT